MQLTDLSPCAWLQLTDLQPSWLQAHAVMLGGSKFAGRLRRVLTPFETAAVAAPAAAPTAVEEEVSTGDLFLEAFVAATNALCARDDVDTLGVAAWAQYMVWAQAKD